MGKKAGRRVPGGILAPSDPIRIFGCQRCSILLVVDTDREVESCVNCKRILDVYSDYKNLLIVREVAERCHLDEIGIEIDE
jgi:hypothetical protein